MAILALVAVVLVFRHFYGYRPTGDELFDRVAHSSLRHYKDSRHSPVERGLVLLRLKDDEPPEFDLSAIDNWEDEFQDDPRYWQLRMRFGKLDTSAYPVPEVPDENGIQYHFDPVQMAWADYLESGRADPGCFALLDYWNFDERETERLLALYDRAIALDPDNSYFYYVKADCLCWLGEIDEAWALIKAGNAAPKNYWVQPFPENELVEYRPRLTSRSNMLAAGVMYLDVVYMPNYIPLMESYKEVCCCCALGYPLELADDYIIRARRMGQMNNDSLWRQRVATILADVPITYVGDELLEESTESHLERLKITAELKAIQSASKGSFDNVMNKLNRGYCIRYDYNKITDGELINAWQGFSQDLAAINANKARFDILDPPPLQIWADGGLVFEGELNGGAFE